MQESGASSDLGGSLKDEPVHVEATRTFNWTGFYVGANLGGSWSNNSASYSQVGGNGAFSTNLISSGAIGGGQAGYNWQSGSFVVGLEADLAGRNNSSSVTALPFGGSPIDAVSLAQREKYLGTVRPRVGLAVDNWLIYATGGLAFGGVEHS